MTKKELTQYLRSTEFGDIADTLTGMELKGTKLKYLFQIGNESSGYFVIKLRKAGRRYVEDSIENMETMKDESKMFHRYKRILKTNDWVLLVSDYVDGDHLHPNHRNEIPRLFSQLASFNQSNMVSGPYTSMCVDGKYFDTVDDLVDWELKYLLAFWVQEKYRDAIVEQIGPLKNGLPCLINEDMNLGNMKILPDKRFVFTDTEWLQRGLNLYQFMHVHYFKSKDLNWYSIADEARQCYASYFQKLDISKEEANRQIRAFEILKVLRSNAYFRYFKQEDQYGLEKNQLERVLETSAFI